MRRARWVGVVIAVGLLASVRLTTPAAAAPPPAFIHNSDLFVDPRNPAVVYASFWIYGVYKSEDHGTTWRPINRGLKNTSVYALALSSANSTVLFAGTHAGGMYRSRDAGETWEEINRGLTSGTVWDLAVVPGRSESVYALTSLGLFVTNDQGEQWTLVPGGIPGPAPDQQMTLFALPSPSGALFLQNGGQIFRWTGNAGWSEPVLSDVTTIRAMPLAYNAAGGVLYAGTSRGLMRSTDRGATWARLAAEPRLPTWLALQPGRPDTLYVGTNGLGVWKSVDGGKSVRAVNAGLEGPTSLKIFGLAINPTDGRRLYAASHSIGLFRSEDGGETWRRPEQFPIPEIRALAEATRAAVMAGAGADLVPAPPAEFRSWCNKCHGWTHPALDARDDVVWRAAPTPRDWTASVARMAGLAGIPEDQTRPIVAYLNAHFGPQRSADGAR